MPYLFVPGRHLVNTRFQEDYLRQVAQPGDHLVFAVTSCNQSRSRYNPVPFPHGCPSGFRGVVAEDSFRWECDLTFGGHTDGEA